MARWLADNRPRRILEVGAGLGTISQLLAETCRLAELIVCVEDDQGCRSAWGRHVTGLPATMHLFDKVPIHETFDLVILDGPQMPPDAWSVLGSGATVFVEGNRRTQRAEVVAALCAQGRRVRQAPSRPPDRSKGYWLLLVDPEPWETVWAMWRQLAEWGADVRARVAGRSIAKHARRA